MVEPKSPGVKIAYQRSVGPSSSLDRRHIAGGGERLDEEGFRQGVVALASKGLCQTVDVRRLIKDAE